MAAPYSDTRSLLSRQEKEIRSCLGNQGAENTACLTDLLASYRSTCQRVILQDFEKAHKENVEDRLWEVHGKVNQFHRSQLRPFRNSNGKRKPVEHRKKEKPYLFFIKSSQQFYRGYLQCLDSQYGGLKCLEAVANQSAPPQRENECKTGNLQRLLLLSCHQTLVRLGDLSRWRETHLRTQGKRNWEPAKAYYDLANRINPGSAASNHQLAVIALEDGDHLEILYRLYLTVVAVEPHPSGQDNLEVEFRKIEGKSGKHEVQGEIDSQNVVQSLVASFLQVHVYCYKGDNLTKLEKLENDMIDQMVLHLKERELDHVLLKIVLINIVAEYFAQKRLNIDPESLGLQQSHCLLQQLNVRTFTALLAIFRDVLKKYDGNEPSAITDAQKFQRVEKLPIVARQILPALRLYSSRMIVDVRSLFGQNDNFTARHIKNMWGMYVNALVLLTSLYPVDTAFDLNLNYLLNEDECTLGLSPFEHPNLGFRYCMEDGITPKPRKGDRNQSFQYRCDNKENLKRIYDLVDDGLVIQQRKVIPAAFIDRWESLRSSVSKPACYPTSKLKPSMDMGEDAVVHVDKTTSPYSVPTADRLSESVDLQQANITHIDETTFPRSELAPDSNGGMDIDQKPTEATEGAERNLRDEYDIQRATPLLGSKAEETSYGVLGSATVSEHFGKTAVEMREASAPSLPSMESPHFASRLEKGKSTKISHDLTHLGSSATWHQGSQKPRFKLNDSRHSPHGSSTPAPSFEQSDMDCLPRSKVKQHPNVRARHVQKALDASKFISSNIFPDSTHEPGSDS